MERSWSGVTIDCLDPERLGRFWGALLQRDPAPGQDGWVHLGQPGDGQPRIVLQPVSEPKQGKARVHLDVTVDSIEAGIATVVALGGAATGERHEHDGAVVVVMTDPEGNEFCLVEHFS